jgi:hypothetical protein
MKMVMPTLTTIQNRHPDPHPPLLLPPPNTIMRKFNINRWGSILLRGYANRRVAYVSRGSQKAVQSL